jgi:hypothetical protein
MSLEDPNDYELIGIDVYEMAQEIFEACNAGNDFCHQTGLVFGGTNRIKLTTRGWVADRSYCTPQFLAAFDKEHGNVT